MATEIKVPHLGMDMHEARIVGWLLAEGDKVTKNAPVLEIETDKAVFEVEAPDDGFLAGIRYAEGTTAPVGDVLAHVVAEGEQPPEVEEAAAGGSEAAEEPAAAESSQPAAAGDSAAPAQPAPAPAPAAAAAAGGRTGASPAAQRLAHERGVDLSTVAGSGPGGRIYAEDVGTGGSPAGVAAAPARAPLGTPGSVEDRDIPTRHGALHARLWHASQAEAGRATVVLIHGLYGEIDLWAGTAAALQRRGLTVAALDLPCHGRSASTVTEFNAIVDAVAEATATLVPGPFALTGHSFGAAVATRVARKPDLDAASLTLLAPLGMGPQIEQAFLDGVVHAQSVDELEAALARLTADGTTPSGSYLADLLATLGQRRDALTAINRQTASNGVQQIGILSDLEALQPVDVRLVTGTADAILPWGQALSAPGHVAVHRLAGVGHMPQWERPGLVNELIVRAARLPA